MEQIGGWLRAFNPNNKPECVLCFLPLAHISPLDYYKNDPLSIKAVQAPLGSSQKPNKLVITENSNFFLNNRLIL